MEHVRERSQEQGLNTRDLLLYLLAACFTVFFLLLAAKYYKNSAILAIHLKFAREVHSGNILVVLHPGFYWLASFFARLYHHDLVSMMYRVSIAHVAMGYLAAVWAIYLVSGKKMSGFAALILAVFVLFSHTIGLPFLPQKVYNFDPMNRSFFLLRNSTSVALAPYALAAFGLLGYILNQHVQGRRSGIITWLGCALILSISCIMKPSLALSLIPATALFVLISRYFDFADTMKVAALLFPAAALIILQFVVGFVYNPYSPQTIHFRVHPWAVWTANNVQPMTSLVLSVLFPLMVSALRYHKLTPITIVAWINLGIAIIPYILFEEIKNVSTSFDRDFEWSYMIGKQVLFVCALAEWWRWLQEEYGKERTLPLVYSLVSICGWVLLLHLGFGLVRFWRVDDGFEVFR